MESNFVGSWEIFCVLCYFTIGACCSYCLSPLLFNFFCSENHFICFAVNYTSALILCDLFKQHAAVKICWVLLNAVTLNAVKLKLTSHTPTLLYRVCHFYSSGNLIQVSCINASHQNKVVSVTHFLFGLSTYNP